MTVLFGSIEFFEQELLNCVGERSDLINNEALKLAHSMVSFELMNDFICAENIKMECLQNLHAAFDRIAAGIKEELLVLV